ncbi:MAG TPA: TonB-dependent receptor [Woeseiaceae bacterium]|nr:TonB-dependent receptor [Woeseiaceae bacterium]
MRPQRKSVAQAVSVALVAGMAPGPLLAQDGQIEEVIVTATKRAESVMDVPIAITAMSGEFIREVNLNDIKDLIQFTPGITGNSKDSFLDFVSVRGIRTIDFGNGGDPSVSLYKNGLYQGRTGAAVSSMYDIERAEVLRGPQGFLFGRNSVSGAFNVITAKPELDATGGYAEVDIGERGVFVFEGALNLPVSETFGLRVAGYHSEEDGYVENLAGGPDLITHDKDALRVSARWETDRLLADVFVEYEDRQQSGTVYRTTGGGYVQPEPRPWGGFYRDPPPLDGSAVDFHHVNMNGGVPYEIPGDGRAVNNDNSLPSRDIAEIFHIGLQLDYDLDWATFTSLTGYKDHDYQYVEDYDGSPIVIFNYGQDQTGDYIEQEFRLTSDTDGPLSWYAGASFYEEDIETVFLGQQSEDVYCAGYWFYSGATTCQEVFDYYNYLDSYYGQTYYCDYYLSYYFGTCEWTGSPDGLINDRNRIVGKYRGYSTYVDLSYAFTETFDVSLGLRYSWDEKEFSQEVLADPGNSLLAYKVQTGFSTPDGPVSDKQDWSEVTYRLVANWRPTATALVFGSITTGYKPGGFGSFNIEPGCEGVPFGLCVADPAVDKPGDFGPENVTSFEIGYKDTWFDNRMQLAANAFVYDYEDLQAIFGEGPRTIVGNVGQVDGTGVEVDVNTVLTDNFSLRLGASWFDSEATNVQAFCGNGEVITGSADACEGVSIPWAPEWTAFAILNAGFEVGAGEAYGTLAWSWEDDYRGDWPDPSVIYQRIPALNNTDLMFGYRTDAWDLRAYVENVFDGVWYDGNYSNDDPDPILIYAEHTFGPSRPRTAGVRFTYNF